MNSLPLLAIIILGLGSPPATFAEPSSPSCETALERVDNARKALLPYKRTMELARARELGAYGELAVCAGGDRSGGDKTLGCRKFQWQPPQRTKYDLAAVDQYRQEKTAFEDLFKQAKHICLLEP